MDQLTIIVAVMTAILFGWIGYFLGNFFPFGGRKQQSSQVSKSIVDNPSKNKLFMKVKEFFSGGESSEEEDQDQAYSSSDSHSTKAEILSKDISHVLYDKNQRKLFADIDGLRIDLDDRLTPEQHSHLSFMLLDLQDKVGISAALRSVIEERTEEAFPLEEDEEGIRPSFNPIKSFVNYVQADVPKLEEKGDSIPSQINQILQEKIKETPLESQGISIGEWPERGVVFIVGVDVYSDIHLIPDSNIRFVIREAVKEWESEEGGD